MNYIIRELRPEETPLLREFLYEAIFVPEGELPPPRAILDKPELQVYLSGFGTRQGDHALVCCLDTLDAAQDSRHPLRSCANVKAPSNEGAGQGEAAGPCPPLGAVWARIMQDYGHIDDDTPSLAIALYREYRGKGIGTDLLHRMLLLLKEQGYRQVSLAVQKENRAVGLYRKAGFRVIRETAEEYIMRKELYE